MAGEKLIREAIEAARAAMARGALPPAENSRLTQIATTGPSYDRALRHLERAGIEGRAIDYGAGRGHGLRSIGADTFEPYPQGWTPTFTKPEDIPDDVYRRLVNLNVLNVLDPEARQSAVLNMGRVVEPGGGGVISTRGRDVMAARGEPGPEPMSLIIGEGDSARYQKGFTPRELREYVGDTLGPRFDVEPSDVGAASIMFRRNREDGGPVEEREDFDKGGVVAKALRSVRQMMERSQDLPPEQRMMVVHKTRLPALETYERLGGLPVPSTAVIKTGEPLTNFGDITLIGNPEILAKPSERNPIFASDVYSPRMPDIQGDKKQFFETYNRYGEPTQHSVTLGNLVRNMRGNVRGGENFGATEGAVRAQITPQFRSVAEMDAARGRLSQSDYEAALAAMKGRSDELFGRLTPLSRNPRDMDFYGDMEGVARIMRQYGNQGAEPLAAYMTKRYNVDNDAITDVIRYIRDMRDMPAPYFEGKPQRAVPFTDFAGALIPEGRTARDAADLLNRQGVRNIEFYNPRQDLGGGEAASSMSDALIERFPGQQFADGGEVRDGYAGGGKPVREALEAAARYIRPRSPEQAAIDVAELLRAAREKEVTDSLLGQADPRALFELYAAGRTGADMPMDYASRMSRAADQGFDKLIYRGTQSREALNRALQTDRLEEGSKTFGTGSWASSDPDVAGTYSGLSEFSPVTIPLMVRSSEIREVPWGGGLWSEGPGGQTTDRVARAAREEGAKGLTFSNITDIGPHLWNRADTQKRLPDTSDTTVIFDPSIVRSPFARFDPRLEHLLDLNRKDGGRAVDVARETLLEDQYPTQYLPNVGRQVMADGGSPAAEKYEAMPGFFSRMLGLSGGPQPEADIQQYENRMRAIAQQPADIQSMTHAPSKPMRPIEIEGGFIGKRQLGEAPYDVAGPLSGMAQTAYSLKTVPFYFTPAAPFAAAADLGEAAIDTKQALNEGDYLGAGVTGALGVVAPALAYRRQAGDAVRSGLEAARRFVTSNPGTATAVGAGAATLAPEEAEAAKLRAVQGITRIARGTPEHATITAEDALKRVVSPFSSDPESIKRALEIAAAYRVPQGTEFGTNSFFRKKPVMGVGDVQADVAPLPGVSPVERRPMSWEDFAREARGGTLINVGGDRLNLGVLRDINNENRLAWDVPLHAGPKYMLEPNPGLVWANAPSHTTSFNRIIKNAAQEGPVYGVYAPMGPTAVDSSVGMFNAVMSQIPTSKISSDAAKEFDEFVLSGKFMTDPDKRAGAAEVMSRVWPGIANIKDQQTALALADQLSGTQRGDLVKSMEASTRRKQGFPDIGATRVAVTDPELLSAPTNTIGHRIVRFDTDGKMSPTRIFPHQTYPTESLGRYVADVPLVQTQYGMPTAMERALMKPAAGGQVVHPYSIDRSGRDTARKLFTEQKQIQPVDDRLIESIMMGLERQKEYGFRRGGGVSHHAMMLAHEINSSPREETVL